MKINAFIIIFILCCVLMLSCAVLDKTHYFKATSPKWKLHTEYWSLALFENCQKWDQHSYTYVGGNETTILYPRVQYVEFLWTPIFIPFIPGLSPLSSSGKNACFEMVIQQGRHIDPNNMMCFIEDQEIYPSKIELGVMNNKQKKVSWWSYWERKNNLYSENQDTSFQMPENWEALESPIHFFANRQLTQLSDIEEYSLALKNILNENNRYDTTAFFYRYKYDIKQSDINEIEVRFKDSSAESILLTRKKGLQYAFTWLPLPVYR